MSNKFTVSITVLFSNLYEKIVLNEAYIELDKKKI